MNTYEIALLYAPFDLINGTFIYFVAPRYTLGLAVFGQFHRIFHGIFTAGDRKIALFTVFLNIMYPIASPRHTVNIFTILLLFRIIFVHRISDSYTSYRAGRMRGYIRNITRFKPIVYAQILQFFCIYILYVYCRKNNGKFSPREIIVGGKAPVVVVVRDES